MIYYLNYINRSCIFSSAIITSLVLKFGTSLYSGILNHKMDIIKFLLQRTIPGIAILTISYRYYLLAPHFAKSSHICLSNRRN